MTQKLVHWLDNQPLTEVMLITFAFFALVQLFYYLFYYIRVFNFRNPENLKNEKPLPKQSPVSIVICAKNEEKNLAKYLPEILTQNYPDYEVIVVNDCSIDSTEKVLTKLKNTYKQLYVKTITKNDCFSHGKKQALTIGLKAAKNDWILLTDADCKPAGKFWLAEMQKQFRTDTDFVIGYGGYLGKKGLLNKLICFDTNFIALQYLTFAKSGMPYMAVGRNLAYRRELFFRTKGFERHAHIRSGDDDLFVNAHARKKNTQIATTPESFTFSEPEQSWNHWIRQKQRHMSTGNIYRFWHKIILGAEPFTRIIFYILFALLVVKNSYLWISFCIFMVRAIVQQIIFYRAMKHFGSKHLAWFGFIFDLILPILNFYFYTTRDKRRKISKWK